LASLDADLYGFKLIYADADAPLIWIDLLIVNSLVEDYIDVN